MADILCPNCKKNNPDFLDRCQFCQTPLKPEAMVQIGQQPTKKDTGDLENVLPEWLRDARQQSRDSAVEDDIQSAAQPKFPKNEAPDLLAGLASQTGRADDDEAPDWLASINPAAKQKPPAPSTPEPETDFFAQFNKSASEPAAAPISGPAQKDAPSWMGEVTSQSQTPTAKDELSEWFSQASEQPVEPVLFETPASQDDMGWMKNLDSSAAPAQEPAPKEAEDLGWLHNLEASAKQSSETSKPQQDMDWMANFETPSIPSQPFDAAQGKPSAPHEDLSWLNNLGGTSEPSSPTPAQSFDTFAQDKPSAPKEDLSWLNDLGGSPVSSQPAISKPSAPQEDLSWLDNLGGTAEPSRPATSQPSAPQEDLSWLNNLGGTPEPSLSTPAQSFDTFAQDKPSAPKEDLGWLDNLGGESAPASQDDSEWLKNLEGPASALPAIESMSPRHTAPLSEEAEASMPDWLKSATEEPSMPMGVEALDQFRDKYRPPATQQPAEDLLSWMDSSQESQQAQEEPLLSPPQPFDLRFDAFGSAAPQDKPATVDESLFAPASDSSTLSGQDVDSLLSMEMPDWLSRPDPGAAGVSSQETATPTIEGGEALSPADLPSWVQAMRPVESVVSEGAPSIEDQPTEREGPLAGLRGLIPTAPIGSARRPKAISLKLQATDEQQASAALLEQVIAGETAPRAIIASSLVMSQRALRWALSGLILVVLGTMIFLRTQTMPVFVSAIQMVEINNISNVILTLPERAPVLVVVDFEPALSGEMEAASGPLLDQMVLLRHPRLSFLSMSPNGSALVERLLANTNINKPAPEGLGYHAGEHYFNLGYLPGGAAGVREFVESPQMALSSAGVARLSEFAAVIVLTDHAESGRVWVEQLGALKQTDPILINQPLLMVSSAQAGPLLQPYVASRQITGMVSGLSDAARYEFINNSRPGIARAYWDAFGVGLMIAIVSITIGGLWSLFTGLRARRAEIEQG